MAEMIRPAMPIAAEPAPRNSTRWPVIGALRISSAVVSPASTIAPVPWMVVVVDHVADASALQAAHRSARVSPLDNVRMPYPSGSSTRSVTA